MSMLDELDALKAMLDELRPLDPALARELDDILDIQWTHHSTALEGNTLTLRETEVLLRHDITASGKPHRDHVEVKDHSDAIRVVRRLVAERAPITEWRIKELHAAVMRGDEEAEPKKFRVRDTIVQQADGAVYHYTPGIHVQSEMEQLIAWHDEAVACAEMHTVELASTFHHRFERVHPFLDGNGRVGRLLMNLELMQHGYTPAIIRNERRAEYLDALGTADAGDCGPLIALVADEVRRTLQLALDVAERRRVLAELARGDEQ